MFDIIDWIEAHHNFASVCSTITASIVAVTVTIILGLKQLGISKQQTKIAHQQQEIALEKLRLDLFYKRMEIFEELISILDEARILAHAGIDQGQFECSNLTNRLISIRSNTYFLFSKKQRDYLDTIKQKIIDLHFANQEWRKRSGSDETEENKQIHDNYLKLVEYFSNPIPEIEKMFKKFLAIRPRRMIED